MKYVPMPRTLECGGEDFNVGISSTSCVQWVVWMLFLARETSCQFVERELLSWQQPGLFGISLGLFWPVPHLDVAQCNYWKLCLVIRDGQLGLILGRFHLDCSPILQEHSTALVFSYHPQMPLHSSSYHISSLHSMSYSSSPKVILNANIWLIEN